MNAVKQKLSYYFGDRAFYAKALSVAVPIMIQNGITNFVNLLDNIMVGAVGTEPMSAVAIVNKLIFVYNLCLFGGCAGVGIFTAQFYGKGDYDGVQKSFRLKLYTNLCLLAAALTVLITAGPTLIELFLHEGSETGDLAKTFEYAKEYLSVILIGIIPQAATEAYSSTLRETEHTTLPMKAGITAIVTNLSLNYVLIFGHFGAPALGVRGAAIATVIAKFVELSVIMLTVRLKDTYAFLHGIYNTLRVPLDFVKTVLPKSVPLLINEALWATGVTALTYCYSLRGLAVVAGYNISTTVTDIFNVATIAFGNAIAIIVGNLLGANRMKEAKQTDARLIVFSFMVSCGLAVILFLAAPLFPKLYTETAEEAKNLATSFLRVYSVYLLVNTISSASYFTLRSGGKTILTFLFDSVYMVCVAFPVAFLLAKFTAMPIVPLYACTLSVDIIKAVVGICLVKSGRWMQNIVTQ